MDTQVTQRDSSYVASEMPIGLEKEIERLRDQALMGWEKEARDLTWFGLRDGMAVLELGSGPGFVTEQLLELAPNGSVTGLEIDPVLIERAEKYLHGKGEGRWRIVKGSVMNMDLPDNSFDFAYARLLFQHLPDPVGAAKEVFRVLKPGGKLVIGDIDDKLHLFDPPPSPEVEVIQQRFHEEQTKKGGNRYVGRKLPRILKQAGFPKVDLEMIMLHNDVVGTEKLTPKQTREDMIGLVTAGLVNEQELDMMLADQELFLSSDPIVMINLIMACGEK
jgi:ubiquinone/menaquinone biosynthesis C-methylase UbiE